MAFPKHHGIALAQNSYVENLVVESFTTALQPTPVEAARFWFNSDTKTVHYSSLNGAGAVIIEEILPFSTHNSYTAALLSTATGSGSALVGYAGQVGANGNFSIAAGLVEAALNSIVSEIDLVKQNTGVSSSLIQAELDSTQVAVLGANVSTYTANPAGNYISGATSVVDSANLLDAQVHVNTLDVAARLPLAGGTMSGNIQMGSFEVFSSVASPSSPAALVTKSYADSIAAGFDPKASVRVATTGPITLSGTQTIDGIAVVVGDRVLVKDQVDATTNGIYSVSATAWARSTDMDGTPVAEVSGGAHTYAETGTVNAGGEFVLLWSGIVTLGTDPLNWSQSGGQGALSGLQAEIDLTQAGAGLDANGAYTASTAGTYLDTATSLFNADLVLDAAITALATVATNIDINLTAVETAVGLSTNGTFVAHVGTNYIDTATTVKGVDALLDAQIKANEVISAGIDSNLTAVETAVGLNANGTFVPHVGTNYIDTATTMAGVDVLLDTQSRANADAILAVDGNLTAVETAVGLNANGTFSVHTTSNYINTATTLKAADALLDTQVKANADAIITLQANVNGKKFTFQSAAAAVQHVITHNFNSPFVNVSVLVEGADLVYRNDIVSVSETSPNAVTIDMTESRNVKVTVMDMTVV